MLSIEPEHQGLDGRQNRNKRTWKPAQQLRNVPRAWKALEESPSPGEGLVSGPDEEGRGKMRTLSQLPGAVSSLTTPGVPEPLLPPTPKTVDQSLVAEGFICMVNALVGPEGSYKASQIPLCFNAHSLIVVCTETQ